MNNLNFTENNQTFTFKIDLNLETFKNKCEVHNLPFNNYCKEHKRLVCTKCYETCCASHLNSIENVEEMWVELTENEKLKYDKQISGTFLKKLLRQIKQLKEGIELLNREKERVANYINDKVETLGDQLKQVKETSRNEFLDWYHNQIEFIKLQLTNKQQQMNLLQSIQNDQDDICDKDPVNEDELFLFVQKGIKILQAKSIIQFSQNEPPIGKVQKFPKNLDIQEQKKALGMIQFLAPINLPKCQCFVKTNTFVLGQQAITIHINIRDKDNNLIANIPEIPITVTIKGPNQRMVQFNNFQKNTQLNSNAGQFIGHFYPDAIGHYAILGLSINSKSIQLQIPIPVTVNQPQQIQQQLQQNKLQEQKEKELLLLQQQLQKREQDLQKNENTLLVKQNEFAIHLQQALQKQKQQSTVEQGNTPLVATYQPQKPTYTQNQSFPQKQNFSQSQNFTQSQKQLPNSSSNSIQKSKQFETAKIQSQPLSEQSSSNKFGMNQSQRNSTNRVPLSSSLNSTQPKPVVEEKKKVINEDKISQLLSKYPERVRVLAQYSLKIAQLKFTSYKIAKMKKNITYEEAILMKKIQTNIMTISRTQDEYLKSSQDLNVIQMEQMQSKELFIQIRTEQYNQITIKYENAKKNRTATQEELNYLNMMKTYLEDELKNERMQKPRGFVSGSTFTPKPNNVTTLNRPQPVNTTKGQPFQALNKIPNHQAKRNVQAQLKLQPIMLRRGLKNVPSQQRTQLRQQPQQQQQSAQEKYATNDFFKTHIGIKLSNLRKTAVSTSHKKAYKPIRSSLSYNTGIILAKFNIDHLKLGKNSVGVGITGSFTKLAGHKSPQGYMCFNNGHKFHKSKGELYCPKWARGDIIIVKADLNNRTVEFIRNNKNLGIAYRNIPERINFCVELRELNTKVTWLD
ncbi:aryl hydrocarbon receptor [Anaeramoeba flamelloides]|uniref:Aryl hydrocarbon receptor n=1 Tax=Anaeramoeba flamelloides TaxID=1746091 RepID=A0ABQ8YU77_9EUKA|nr:aryl hydrocarbon receptor [Anaeramoeba flamelloides]